MANHYPDCDGNGTVTCWECGGSRGWRDCGEDCCCCLDPEEITELCPECGGRGVLTCPGCESHDPGCVPTGGKPNCGKCLYWHSRGLWCEFHDHYGVHSDNAPCRHFLEPPQPPEESGR